LLLAPQPTAHPDTHTLSLHDALPISSSEKGLREAGQKGLANTQDEAVIRLVTQMTADTAEERKTAVTLLIDQYRESPSAISATLDRKSTRLNSSHRTISYAVFCLKKK